MRLWSIFACLGLQKATQSSERQCPMPTQDPAMSCHTRQFPSLGNSSSASLATTAIPNEYRKVETMSLQHPVSMNQRVIKVQAIHHFVGTNNGNLFSTVQVILLLDGNQTKQTTMRYPDVIEMLGGKAELVKFGSTIADPVL